MNNDKIKPILQQDFPELQGDPKINIPHSDTTIDAIDDSIKGEMLNPKKDGSSLLG